MVISYNYVKGVVMLFPKPKKVKDRKARERVRQKFCEYCGVWETVIALQVHHIYTQGGSGPGDIDENMVTLCVVCHDKAQRYLISRDELFALVALRMNKTIEEVKEKVSKSRGR
jgi:5-methylcytosine-specific restriction endonuclease McrA